MTEGVAYLVLEQLRWGSNGPQCPHCDNAGASFIEPGNGVSRRTRTGAMSERRVWRCSTCEQQFSVLTGTPLEGTKAPIRLWLLYAYEIWNGHELGVREMMRTYGVSGRTARRMRDVLHGDVAPRRRLRIRRVKRQQKRQQQSLRMIERRIKRVFASRPRSLSLDAASHSGISMMERPHFFGMPSVRSAEDEALDRLDTANVAAQSSGMSCGECGRMQSKGEWVKGSCPRCGSALFVPSRHKRAERIDPLPTVGLSQSNGMVHHMAPRHRGRIAQRALMAGSRNSRKPRSKR